MKTRAAFDILAARQNDVFGKQLDDLIALYCIMVSSLSFFHIGQKLTNHGLSLTWYVHLLSDMHYGQGMMKEEIERARKRAEAASTRTSGFSYKSPLGAGFSFDKGRPMNEQMNPYSRRGNKQHDHLKDGGFRIEYEEAYLDMNVGGIDLSDSNRATRAKEFVVERMNDRRKYRVRERGDPNPHQNRRRRERQQAQAAAANRKDSGAEDDGCVIM